ncbi:hypothetical protein O1B78_003584 [Vibrio cholerae]|uniref:hypothetical protein n=1 Tax=Vibrio metoecus TaxID=1481663 RepID=UPI000BA9D080|nr:hypothetical protein [Vibrio metoecus]EKF9419387.1 hypothetical protein [Vibrio cholerae]PAR33922.1 hypothetical protein CGT97_18680 [Vibrio metoecus]PAR40822.1 hypothetical protein CGT96_17505 [Vibrio metoecus]
MKIVQDLYHKCLSKEIQSNSVKKTPNQCLKDVEQYLEDFQVRFLKKNKVLNYDYAIPVIFRDELVFNTKTEMNAYCKCQLSIAFKWFKNLLFELRKDQTRITTKRLNLYKEYIMDFLHDVSFFIEYYEQKNNPDFKFLNGGKSYGQETVFIYKNAINSYWGTALDQNNLDHKGNLSASSYFLRQSLELKFRRILGVNDIVDSNGNRAKIRHEYFPEFINKNISHFDLNGSKIPNLLKIYKWTNQTIHTSAVPLIWEQWFAFEYCNSFIFPSQLELGKKWSIHNSVKVSGLNSLIEKLYADFSSQYNANGYWCFYISSPQAEVVHA